MNIYVCYGFDDPDKLAIRLSYRNAHLERIAVLDIKARIITAGPMFPKDNANSAQDGFIGSLILARFDDLKSAKTWWSADPYVQNGVFRDWNVYPFTTAFPKKT